MSGEVVWVWVGAFLTLCILSFLYRDNPFYRFGEHLFVGVSNGYLVSFMFHRVIMPVMIVPLGGAFRSAGESGLSWGLFNPLAPQNFLLIVPGLIGCLYFARFIRGAEWLVRIPIGIFMGYYTGLSVPAQFEGVVFPQMQSTLVTRADFAGSGGSAMGGFWSLVVLLGVIGTLCYFFFSREHKGIWKLGAKTGIVFVMVGFGASFGFTVMARVSLAIGRFLFLLRDWLGIIS